MTTTIPFPDWVDCPAIELTFGELYASATPSRKHEMAETVRRLAEGIGEVELASFVARIPDVDRALSSFAIEEQSNLLPRLSNAATELARMPPMLSPAGIQLLYKLFLGQQFVQGRIVRAVAGPAVGGRPRRCRADRVRSGAVVAGEKAER